MGELVNRGHFDRFGQLGVGPKLEAAFVEEPEMVMGVIAESGGAVPRNIGGTGDHGGQAVLGRKTGDELLADPLRQEIPIIDDGRVGEAVSYTHLDVYKRQVETPLAVAA